MSYDWKSIWAQRAQAFNSTLVDFPDSRNEERNTLIDMLRLSPGHRFLEVAPCGGCLLRGVHARYASEIAFYAVEPSDENAASLPKYVKRVNNSDICAFALNDKSVDRVANLAGLHHTWPRGAFFSESYRVLNSGGILAVADVLAETSVASWLNEFVNEFNEFGHEGRFFDSGELRANLTSAGFVGVVERVVDLSWRFDSTAEAVTFCRNLFYLNRAKDEEILAGLKMYLGFDSASIPTRIPWRLVYASGCRAT